MDEQPNNPLHGMTLERILEILVDHYGWEGLNKRIEIRCFFSHPSIKSSLTFLRKNLWARNKVEALYIELLSKESRLRGFFVPATERTER